MEDKVKKLPRSSPVSVHNNKQPPPLLVSIESKKKKKAEDPFPVVELVTLWVLLTACAFVSAFGFALNYSIPSSTPPPWWMPPHVEMTAAEDAEVRALEQGMLWCSAPQAVAAALALLHRGRHRRALAFVALAVAAVSHCMYARFGFLLLTTAPAGYLFFKTISIVGNVVIAVCDLLSFLALLLLGGQE